MIKTIGIIDDDEIFLMLAIVCLKNFFPDAAYFTAKNGEEALQQLENLTPDLLLLDLNMPVMNGWELLAELENKNEKIAFPIYITTSSVDPGDKRKGENHPLVKGFIEKPLNQEKIRNLGIK